LARKRQRGGRWHVLVRNRNGDEVLYGTYATKRDADDALTKLGSDDLKGLRLDVALSRLTLADWSLLWLADKEGTIKASTLESYRSLLRSRILPALGDYPLREIDRADVRQLINDLKGSASMSRTRQALIVIRSMLDEAVLSDAIGKNPQPVSSSRRPAVRGNRSPSPAASWMP
jgi:hypothetical protein